MSDGPNPSTPKWPPPDAAGFPSTEPLGAERIQEGLAALSAWQLTPDGKAIRRTWPVPSLWTGTALASRHATIIEGYRHTATLTVTAAAVEVVLTTAAAGGVTAKDLAVALALEC
jgi:4a-hydroxytetrahydrobiopterin dehydratase